jgi:hypothetical protein
MNKAQTDRSGNLMIVLLFRAPLASKPLAATQEKARNGDRELLESLSKLACGTTLQEALTTILITCEL